MLWWSLLVIGAALSLPSSTGKCWEKFVDWFQCVFFAMGFLPELWPCSRQLVPVLCLARARPGKRLQLARGAGPVVAFTSWCYRRLISFKPKCCSLGFFSSNAVCMDVYPFNWMDHGFTCIENIVWKVWLTLIWSYFQSYRGVYFREADSWYLSQGGTKGAGWYPYTRAFIRIAMNSFLFASIKMST